MTARATAAGAETGRKRIVEFRGNYHGWYDTVALNDTTGGEKLGEYDTVTTGLLPDATEEAVVLPSNDLDAVETAVENHEDGVAGVILGSVTRDMCRLPPVDGHLRGLRDVTDDHGALLVFGEIVALSPRDGRDAGARGGRA